VKNFVRITRLLHELTKKEQKWEWKIRHEKLFETFVIDNLYSLNLFAMKAQKVETER